MADSSGSSSKSTLISSSAQTLWSCLLVLLWRKEQSCSTVNSLTRGYPWQDYEGSTRKTEWKEKLCDSTKEFQSAFEWNMKQRGKWFFSSLQLRRNAEKKWSSKMKSGLAVSLSRIETGVMLRPISILIRTISCWTTSLLSPLFLHHGELFTTSSKSKV